MKGRIVRIDSPFLSRFSLYKIPFTKVEKLERFQVALRKIVRRRIRIKRIDYGDVITL
jgi:hypothetical protein